PTAVHPPSLHDALPISSATARRSDQRCFSTNSTRSASDACSSVSPFFDASLLRAYTRVGIGTISLVERSSRATSGTPSLVCSSRSEEHTSELHHVKISY